MKQYVIPESVNIRTKLVSIHTKETIIRLEYQSKPIRVKILDVAKWKCWKIFKDKKLADVLSYTKSLEEHLGQLKLKIAKTESQSFTYDVAAKPAKEL